MNKYTTFVFLLFLSSCSLFKAEKISKNIPRESKKICLNSVGKGRIEMEQGKYIFSYESALLEEEGKFIMVLNFPLYGEERFEISWLENTSDSSANSQLEHRLLSSGDGVNPIVVQSFISLWASYFKELISLQQNRSIPKSLFDWKIDDQKLIATSRKSHLKFNSEAYVANESFFERLTFEMIEKNLKSASALKVELFVRECLEKTE